MALLASQGHRVVLVTATRGELGEAPEGLLGPDESLSERRERELARACELLGVARHEFLGYRDSGMEGEPSNDDPSCFWQADVEEAASRLSELLSSEGADVLTVYDERGVYGHPDHVQVHRVGMRAAQLAGTSRVFMSTINRDHLVALAARAREFGFSDLDGVREDLDNLGVEAGRITTAIDVSEFLDLKRQAMAAHASQISEMSYFLSIPPEAFAAVWGTEWFIRVGAEPGVLESSLFAR